MKPFLTNKGSKDGSSSIMIKTEDTIEIKPKEVVNLMNEFYVNSTSEIDGNINLYQCDSSDIDFVLKCERYFEYHSSIRKYQTWRITWTNVSSLSDTLVLVLWRR